MPTNLDAAIAEYSKGNISADSLRVKYNLNDQDFAKIKEFDAKFAQAFGIEDNSTQLPDSREITLDNGTKVLVTEINTATQANGGVVTMYMDSEGNEYYQYKDKNGESQKIMRCFDPLGVFGDNLSAALDKCKDGQIWEGIKTAFSGAENPNPFIMSGIAPCPSTEGGTLLQWLSKLVKGKNAVQGAKTVAAAAEKVSASAVKTERTFTAANGKVYKVAQRAPRAAQSAENTSKAAANTERTFTAANGKVYKVAQRAPRAAQSAAEGTSAAAAETGSASRLAASAEKAAVPQPKPSYAAPKPNAGTAASNTGKAASEQPKYAQTVEKSRAASVNKAPVKEVTYESVEKEFNNVRSQLSNMRNNVKAGYSSELSALEAKQAQLESSLTAHMNEYRQKTAELTNKIDDLGRLASEEQNTLINLQKQAESLEQEVVKYKSALGDLEKEFSAFESTNGIHGSTIGELDKYAAETPKRFIGAEFKNNVNVKPTPKNAQSYYYSEDIADTFHSYNVAQNKSQVVSGLRNKVSELEKKLTSVKSKISNQTGTVEYANNKLNAAYTERNILENTHNNFVGNYYKEGNAIKTQIGQVTDNMNNAMSELKGTEGYKTLEEQYKTLQIQLRELNPN